MKEKQIGTLLDGTPIFYAAKEKIIDINGVLFLRIEEDSEGNVMNFKEEGIGYK